MVCLVQKSSKDDATICTPTDSLHPELGSRSESWGQDTRVVKRTFSQYTQCSISTVNEANRRGKKEATLTGENELIFFKEVCWTTVGHLWERQDQDHVHWEQLQWLWPHFFCTSVVPTPQLESFISTAHQSSSGP